jgi:poly(ADP-ribose) glycohydrolase ARH3
MLATHDQFQGCLVGLALGDALGAPFEGGILERTVWRLIGRTRNGDMRWTDDTQMTIDVVESLLAQGRIDPDDLAIRFAANYRWSRGYGPGTAKLLKRIARGANWRDVNRSIYREGSFGNGAAMRSPIIGLFFGGRTEELVEAVRTSATITHAHPIGIAGAVLLAAVTERASRHGDILDILHDSERVCELEPFKARLAIALAWLQSKKDVPVSDVKQDLGNGIAAHESVVTSIYLALRFRDDPFVTMQKYISAIGGDVDTIGAMAGAVWGAMNGLSKLPSEQLSKLEQCNRLAELATELHRRAANSNEKGNEKGSG